MKPSTRMVVLGGRKLWTPAALGSSLSLWLDADDALTITLNGSKVSQWGDKSGNNRNIFQSTPANQPTYSATELNGGSLTFSGTNWFTPLSFSLSSFSLILSGSISQNATLIYYPIGLGVNTGVSSRGTFNNQKFSLYNGSASLTSVEPVSLNTPFMLFASGANGQRQLSVNGGTVYTDTFTQSVSGFSVGRREDGFWPFSGDISEIVQTASVVSTENRQKLHGYLAHKRGLTANLPSDHPFKFTPPYI